MQGLIRIVSSVSKVMTMVGNVVLVFMILLTVTDVIMRNLGRPIIGTYELVSFSGAVAMWFSVPFTSWMKRHISLDFLILTLPQTARKIFNVVTKCAGMGLFLIMGANLIILGTDLRKAGEVSLTMQIPFYPVIHGLGICCFIECLVLFCDIVRWRKI